MIQTNSDSEALSGGESLDTGLLNYLSEEDAESFNRSLVKKIMRDEDLNTLRDCGSNLNSGIGSDQSLHTGLLNLADEDAESQSPSSSPASASARSRWSKVHHIIAIHRLFPTQRPPKPKPSSSSSPLPYISVPQVDNDVRISIQEEEEEEETEESVIPFADTDDAIGLSRNSSSPSSSDNRTINVGDANACNRSFVKRIVSDEDLNTLRDCGSYEYIASLFNSNLESGLGSSAAARLQEQEVVITTAKSLSSYFIHETKTWNIVLLVTAGLLSMATGMLDYGPNSGWHDSLAIFVAILLLITVPSLAKFRQAKKLKKKMQKQKVDVIREGSRQEIVASAVVAGDLVILEKGIRLPGDGLLVHGSDDGLDFDERANKPFLRVGAKVVCGTGRMMVTSVGSDTKMGELMRNVNCDLNAPTFLQSWILGPMSYMDMVSLCILILVIIVIFIHFRHKNHDKSLPEMKGKPPLEHLMRLFMRSLVRPRGLVSFLGTAISTLVMVYQQGVPLAITLALSYCNQKLDSSLINDDHHAHPQNLSACATMGFVNVICFDISGEMVLQTMEEAISAIKTFSKEGVSVKIISEDKLDEVRSILDQHSLNFGTLDGDTFRCLEDNVRKERINYKIMVMEEFTAPDKLKLVQCLKQEGNVVAFCLGSGRRSDDTPALIEADVGLVYGNCNTEFLKEASDIIVISRGRGRGMGLSSIYSLWKRCRCISNNLQKFTALQLIVCVSGLIINSLSNLVLGESTMTTIQVVWANTVICILGGSMMIIQLPNCELKVASDRLLGSRTNPLTKGMWMNIVIQILYQVFVMMFFLFEGHITRRLLGINQDIKNTFVFNSFILCQVVNILNTMQLDKKEVLLITMKCYIFLASLVSILAVQILLVQFASCLANFSKLNCVQWVECFILALFPWLPLSC